MWQTEIGNYGSFFVLYPPLLKIQIIRILKYYHFTQVYQKPQSYEVQFLRYGVRQTKFLVIFGHFLPLYPPKNQKNQNFKTIKKKASWDVITLHMCTKNHDHMMYASWDMEYKRPNFLSFWAIFCSFTPLLTPKIKIWKKLQKTGDIILLHWCTINEVNIVYGSWDIRHNKQSFLLFWVNFCPLTFLTTWKIEILKKWKKHLEILSFYTCIP